MTTTTRLQGRRILIVDDDQDILGSIDLALRAEGAETDLAADGKAAVEAAHASNHDAVVLDMMLPIRSGFMVLEKLREEAKPPIVVMVSANEGKRHMTYAQSLGVDAYFVKPVPLRRLVETVVQLIGAREGR
jgi:DNA-binding response OmpR family regulator